LFKNPAFRRDPDGEDANRLLNYGYAVLRAIVARAICAVGLHPTIGLHHHNRYDAFPLVDDLMEPLRPVVDRAVTRLIAQRGDAAPLDREAKATLIASLLEKFDLDGEKRTLFDIAERIASSLAAVFTGKRQDLSLPDFGNPAPAPE
jgi:CRISPR-associated protein Cas1